jgi:CHRD domain-containing protein
MRRTWLLLAAALASGLASIGSAGARTVEFEIHATLDSRQAIPRPPHPVARATGALTGGLDRETRTVTWKLVYRGLSGPATAAEIHLGRPGATGPVALALCGPRAGVGRISCRSGVHGVATFSAKTISALQGGLTYVNVHTRRNQAGEIRGQILTFR